MRRFGRREVGEGEQISGLALELDCIPLSACSGIPESWRNQNKKAGLVWLWDLWIWLRRKGFWLPPRLLFCSQTSMREGILWLYDGFPNAPTTCPPLFSLSGEGHR